MIVDFIYILHPEVMADFAIDKMVVDTSTRPYC